MLKVDRYLTNKYANNQTNKQKTNKVRRERKNRRRKLFIGHARRCILHILEIVDEMLRKLTV